MIVLVGNTKGGVGKTTLAVQIALRRAMQGSRVWFIDGDRQGSGNRADAGHGSHGVPGHGRADEGREPDRCERGARRAQGRPSGLDPSKLPKVFLSRSCIGSCGFFFSFEST